MQRMIPGLILTNAMLFFMMMASSFVKTTKAWDILLCINCNQMISVHIILLIYNIAEIRSGQ